MNSLRDKTLRRKLNEKGIFIAILASLFCLMSLHPPASGEKTTTKTNKINPVWDSNGLKIYNDTLANLKDHKVQTINLVGQGEVTVSEIVNNNIRFWEKVNGRAAWEPQTFRIFKKYVTSETIVIDFGTWIGPTLLFHGQFSKQSYGIEADPAAYAVVEYNVNLNRDRDWGKNVFVESACVSALEDVGTMKMNARVPGESMSGITSKLARRNRYSWEVECRTLPTIIETWKVDLSAQPVMFKIDVESYECKLIPSFYEWLKDLPSLPTIFVSFHPQINDCTDEEWRQILNVFKLYEKVNAGSDTQTLPIESETTFTEFQKIKESINWMRNCEVVLTGKR